MLFLIICATLFTSNLNSLTNLSNTLYNSSITISGAELISIRYQLEEAFNSLKDPDSASRAIVLLEILLSYDHKNHADHLYRLALLYLNQPNHKLRKLYFIKALHLFIQFYESQGGNLFAIRAPKVLIRAAYCAKVIGLNDLATDLLDEYYSKYPNYRPTEIEKSFLKYTNSKNSKLMN